MSADQPVLAGKATINAYLAGAADLSSPVLLGVVVDQLDMLPQFRKVEQRLTGAASYKHRAIVTHHIVRFQKVLALTAAEAFSVFTSSRLVLEVTWHPDPDGDGRWKRRYYTGVQLASEGLSSAGALQIGQALEFTAENVTETGSGSGSVPSLSLPLPA